VRAFAAGVARRDQVEESPVDGWQGGIGARRDGRLVEAGVVERERARERVFLRVKPLGVEIYDQRLETVKKKVTSITDRQNSFMVAAK
jgi:predicted transcriptional regulator with HTH domain